jgi:organic hydroperoxide reductase OsmC/OhrA
MSTENPFEVSLSWPADPAQAMPPTPKFSRDSTLVGAGKLAVPAGLPPSFGGDGTRYNPEELMIMSLAQCHMLTFLAYAEKKHVVVLRYEDRATGTLARNAAGKTAMQEVTLRPRVVVAAGTVIEDVTALHGPAHANCFMANSINFEMKIEPETVAA